MLRRSNADVADETWCGPLPYALRYDAQHADAVATSRANGFDNSTVGIRCDRRDCHRWTAHGSGREPGCHSADRSRGWLNRGFPSVRGWLEPTPLART